MTTSTNILEDNSIPLSWKELSLAQFTFNKPFHLQLSDGEFFFAERVIRLIPKRRMVVFGFWKGKAVVAKLFFNQQHSKRHMEKDVAGILSLQTNSIPTPSLCFKGTSHDKRIHVLLLERIYHAKNFEEIWRAKDNIGELLPLLRSIVLELATQHVLGILQHDLHLKNFMLTDHKIYTLDGAEIQSIPHLVSKKDSLDNLGLFLSQLGVHAEGYHQSLFEYYCKARSWFVKKEDINTLYYYINYWNTYRWRRYERKIFRECSDFACIHTWRTFGMINRHYGSPEMVAFLKNPESVFSHPAAILLKAGRSSTVIKIKLDQDEFVIKRYNLKNTWHRLRRCLRSTRAASSWRLAQKLDLFGITTAKPVAFIENRFLGLHGRSYFVTEYVSGSDASNFFDKHKNDPKKVNEMVRKITTLLKLTSRLEITHGDLKLTNILIDHNNQPVLIDLDGANEHASLFSLKKAWRKEIKRFLKNFDDQPFMIEEFKGELAEHSPFK